MTLPSECLAPIVIVGLAAMMYMLYKIIKE